MHFPHILELPTPFTITSPFGRMQNLGDMAFILVIGHGTVANWKYSPAWLLKFQGKLGSVRNNSEVKEQKRTYEERQLRQWNCRIIIWEQKPRTTNAIVYDSIRSVERNSEKQLQFSLTWFVLISEHTSGYPQYFPLTEGNFWNTAKCKTTFSTKPNPEVYNPLAAYFREFKGRSKGNPKKREFYEKTSL